MSGDYQVGIEEEYFVVDLRTQCSRGNAEEILQDREGASQEPSHQ